jgi:PAS domain S-box-containing protein
MVGNRPEQERQLRQALIHGEVVPFFQPLVEVRSGVISGFEVLARWNHPLQGTILPEEFIPIAEDLGLIGMLTEKILLQAFTATAAVAPGLELSINISPIQLRDRSLPEQIRLLAKERAFPLDHLTIEITESALVDNLEQASSIATELKRLGVKLALDDFGTGYSSLRHLQALPFDEIKVDRSFVSSMISERDNRKIVAAVIGLGQSLGLITVAEGVEDRAQADMLQWLGCELAQGWLYGQAVPATEIPRVLAVRMHSVDGPSGGLDPANLSASIEPPPSHRLAQCRAIYDGAPVGLCLLDRSLRYVSINQRLADLNRAPVCVHLGRTVAEMVPQIFDEIKPYLLRALNGESISGVEVSRPGYSGLDCLGILASYEPARDEAGEVVGISVAVVDITQRKRSEEALLESESHYRHMVELNPHTPWVLDAQGRALDLSPRWLTISGLTWEQSQGRGFLNAVHPDDLQRVVDSLDESIASGEPIDIECRIGSEHKGWRWVRSRGGARRDDKGQIIRWYGSVEDIDECKRLEASLQKCKEELKAVLAQKSRESI